MHIHKWHKRKRIRKKNYNRTVRWVAKIIHKTHQRQGRDNFYMGYMTRREIAMHLRRNSDCEGWCEHE